MKKLTSRRATIYCIVLFMLTIAAGLLLPEYPVALGCLLLTVLLTVFIQGNRSTLAAGFLGGIVMILFGMLQRGNSNSLNSIIYTGIGLLLIFLAALLIIQVKNIYQNISFDKNHMTSLFENATEGIILTNGKGNIVLVNPAAEKMFEYQADELIGQPIEILIPEKYRKRHVQLREGFHKAPQDRIMGHGRDLHGLKKNGKNFPVEVSLSYYKRNNEPYAIAFIVDITTRKEIESNMLHQQQELEKVTRDIRKLNTQLEAKVEERTTILKEALMKLEQSQQELSEALDKERELNEIKSRFVSMASHEFRTPLSTILSSASLLGKYLTTEEQQKRDKHIFRIKDSVKHLNDILEDFLSLGRLDEGKITRHPVIFDLSTLINDTADEMKGLLKKDQSISYHHTGKDEVHSDKKLLKNILINLITNAIKFSSEGEIIRVNSDVKDGVAQITVSDTGIGISREDQEHLFSSFFRGKNAMNIQGTGLGLHLVKRYTDLLGGKVYLKSEMNKGTLISVSIPITNDNNL